MALGPLGWEAAWLAEVDVAASAVLAHHYGATAPRFPPSFEDDPPEKKGARTAEQKSAAYERSKKRIAWGDRLTNWGDMTRLLDLIRSGEVEAPELLCGGTPCQSFSIAGLREGLRDPRGGLTLTFVEIVDAIDERRAAAGLEPCVALWENVPGVLSHADNPFGCFLAALAGEDVPLVPSGKRWPNAGVVLGPKRAVAWRVGDAQYFGLAQRRNRVYVVASARDGADPAGILFEFGGARRDSAPSRETGAEVAGTLEARTSGGGFPGTDEACSGYVQPVRRDLVHGGVENARPIVMAHGQANAEIYEDGSATTLTCLHEAPIVVHGSQNPILQHDRAMPLGRNNGAENAVLAFSSKDYGADVTENLSPTLRAMGHAGSHPNAGGQVAVVIPFDTTQITSRLNRSAPQPGDPCRPLVGSGHPPAIAYAIQERAGATNLNAGPQGKGYQEGLAYTLEARHHVQSTVYEDTVRRLTPKEAERLQGFPDGYTHIPIGKALAADGPRYKQLGNSWAVNHVRWIGRRLTAHLDDLDRARSISFEDLPG